jgi:hypothetical protein
MNPNERFAEIDTIMVAVQASRLLEAQRESNAEEQATERAATEIAA